MTKRKSWTKLTSKESYDRAIKVIVHAETELAQAKRRLKAALEKAGIYD